MAFTGRQLNELIKSQAKSTIKKSVQDKIDIYKDNWDHIIRNELIYQFTDENANDLRKLVTKEFNILKRVINEISLVYKIPPKREAILTEANKENNIEAVVDENYQLMLSEIPLFNTVQKNVNRYTNLTNHVAQRVVWRDQHIDFDILMFNNVEILTHPEDWRRIIAYKFFIGLELPEIMRFTDPDNPNKISESKYETALFDHDGKMASEYKRSILYTIEDYEDKDNEIIFQKGMIYTFEQQIGNENFKEILIDTRENPYTDINGNVILPFVLYSKTFPTDTLLDFTTGNDMVDATIHFAMDLIHLNELIKYQSYIQLWMVVKDKSSLPKTLKLSPKDILAIKSKDGVGSVGTLDLQSAIDKLWAVIKERVTLVLSNYGISPQNFTMSGQPASGFALQLDNRMLLEMREDEIEIYRAKEKELFNIMRSVWNFHNPDKMIDVKSKLKIDFGEIEFPLSMDELGRNMSVNIMNNIKTPVDFIMDENPDFTRKEAENKFAENKAFNQSQKAVILPTQQPGGNNAIEERKEQENNRKERGGVSPQRQAGKTGGSNRNV